MDALLIEHQQADGNRINGQWTSSSYDLMVNELRKKLDMPIKKEHIMNRQKTLKRRFNEAHDMFRNSSGFGWDEEIKRFVAEPEVWESLIESKPKAAKWKTTYVPFYDKLTELYAKDRAVGTSSKTAKERLREIETVESIDDIDTLVSQNKIILERFTSNGLAAKSSGDSSVESQSHHKTSQSSAPVVFKVETSSKGGKRKRSSNDEQELMLLKQGLDGVADAIKEGNLILSQVRPKVYSSEEVFQEILNIGVEESNQFKAYRFLNAKPSRVSEIFECPAHLRKAFLVEMMEEDQLM